MNSDCNATPKPKSLKALIRSWSFWKPVLGILIGGILGYLFYYFVGCQSGTCAITSSPYGSIITGGLLGFLVSGSPCLSC